VEVRREAVGSLVDIGTQHSLNPLIEKTRDNDPEVQMLAVDGIVNFYYPGYVEKGWASKITSAVRKRFERENRDIIDPYVTVRPEAIEAIARLITGGSSMESRATAARAAGILRGKAAIDDLIKALRSKDDTIMYESLIALQKIRDTSAGPRVIFLLRDLEDRIQIAAIETVGLLRTREAVEELQRAYREARNDKVRRAALSALAMVPHETSRPYFQQGFTSRDEHVRTAAAEGYARLRHSADAPALLTAFESERKMPPRLALAFALVANGRYSVDPMAPLTYLVNTLNSRAWRGVAEPYLVELAREPQVRQALHGFLRQANREEKIGLARVLAMSGDQDTVATLDALTRDADSEVAAEAVRSLRTLRARLRQTASVEESSAR
jgi:HEAT repeat protein